MHNLEIVRSFKVKVTFTLEDWELYEGAEYATREINNQLEQSINNHSDRDEVEREMESVMNQFAQYGATDSEPHWHLQKVLDFVYGAE